MGIKRQSRLGQGRYYCSRPIETHRTRPFLPWSTVLYHIKSLLLPSSRHQLLLLLLRPNAHCRERILREDLFSTLSNQFGEVSRFCLFIPTFPYPFHHQHYHFPLLPYLHSTSYGSSCLDGFVISDYVEGSFRFHLAPQVTLPSYITSSYIFFSLFFLLACRLA